MRKFSVLCFVILSFSGVCDGEDVFEGTKDSPLECQLSVTGKIEYYAELMKEREPIDVLLPAICDKCSVSGASTMSLLGRTNISLDDQNIYRQNATVFLSHVDFQCNCTVFLRHDGMLDQVKNAVKPELFSRCEHPDLVENIKKSTERFSSSYITCLKNIDPSASMSTDEPETSVKTSISGTVRNITIDLMLIGDMDRRYPGMLGEDIYNRDLKPISTHVEYAGKMEMDKCMGNGLAESVCTCLQQSNFVDLLLDFGVENFICGAPKYWGVKQAITQIFGCRDIAQEVKADNSNY